MPAFGNMKVLFCVYFMAIQITRAAPPVFRKANPQSSVNNATNENLTNILHLNHLKRALCDNNGDTMLIGDLSLCPWTMQTTENRFRQPIRIRQAECVFDRPIDIPGLACRPVYRDTEVKVRNRKTMERVSVACTAVPLCY